ncbi:MAG: methyltransferase domain-containing protein [Acidimicrobiales bacterium]
MAVRSNARSWDGYVQHFHEERAGITERVLRRCLADGQSPYEWCAEALKDGGPVLDLACGSGPMADHTSRWFGTDRSGAELGAARSLGRGPLVRADAGALPVRSASVTCAVCSMGLQVVEPLGTALGELGRVLTPGGQAVALVPAGGPLGWRDALAYVRLQVALRTRIRYPNGPQLAPGAVAAALELVQLRIVTDEQRAFGLSLRAAEDVATLVTSLYLPDVDPPRVAAARRVLARRISTDLAVPLRRLVLESTVPSVRTRSEGA